MTWALADYVGSCHSETALGDAFEYLAGDWFSENPDWTEDLADLAPSNSRTSTPNPIRSKGARNISTGKSGRDCPTDEYCVT